jgi:hypothetical protein
VFGGKHDHAPRSRYPRLVYSALSTRVHYTRYHSVQNLLYSSLLSKDLSIKIYGTIILPVVLYGCENWSLTSREKRRLMVSENRVLRILGPERDQVAREWRKLHNEELNDISHTK